MRLRDGAETLFPVNIIGNLRRPALLHLSDRCEAEAAVLLAELQTMYLNDECPLWEILGLAIPVPVDTAWKQLRIGEPKTLLAQAVGDGDAISEGGDWIHHFATLARRAGWCAAVSNACAPLVALLAVVQMPPVLNGARFRSLFPP